MPKEPLAVKKKPAPPAAPAKAAPKKPLVNEEERRQKIEAEAERQGLTVLSWPPDKLVQFARGAITLAQLDGVSDEQLLQMAEVGHALLSQGKLDDAKKVFTGLTVFNPYDAYYQLALGSIAQRSADMELAEQHYTRAIEINSGIGAAFANRAEVRIFLGKLSDAIGDLVKSIAISASNPSDASAARSRVTLSAIQKRVDELQQSKGV